MADPMAPMPPSPPGGGGGILERAGGFLSTTTGRLIAGGVALVLVVAIAGGVVLFTLSRASDGSDVEQGTAPVASTPAQEIAEPVERDPLPLSSSYSFRDIFKRTVTVSELATATAIPIVIGEDGVPSDVPADTLFLYDIVLVKDVYVASFIWNGSTYSAYPNGILDGTPWKVLSTTATSAVMLYGDTQFTLYVGQGMATYPASVPSTDSAAVYVK